MTFDQVLTLLADTPAQLRFLLKQVDDELARWRPEEEKWCINEVIGHLSWTDEHAFTNRILLMTEQPNCELPLIDVNKAARERQDNLKLLEDSLKEFADSRAKQLERLKGIDENKLSNTALYKGKTFLASDFVYEWPFHDYGHICQITRILRANLAPYMSETMRRAVGY